MTEVATLQERYAEVTGRIADAAQRAGRRPQDVILVAVTKYAEPDQIKALVEMGHRHLGESQAQQIEQRAAIIDEYAQRLRLLERTRRSNIAEIDPSLLPAESDDPVRWHMIGHLQRNKAKKIAPLVRLVHSVDSLRLAEELQQIGLKKDIDIEVLVQVDCAGEDTKHGCPLPAAFPLAEQIETMAHVHVRGLMTMAPHTDNPEDARPVFARCRELFDEIKTTGIGEGKFNLLSMGMTADYEVGIEEGANIVRVGSALFGS